MIISNNVSGFGANSIKPIMNPACPALHGSSIPAQCSEASKFDLCHLHRNRPSNQYRQEQNFCAAFKSGNCVWAQQERQKGQK